MWNTSFGWVAVPLVYAVASALTGSRSISTRRAWDVGVGAALANVCVAAAHGLSVSRADVPALTMLLLVTTVGAIILRFSRRYLDGEPGQKSFVRWFLATVAAATVLVGSKHLLVLALAWTATSVSLHQLLMFYGERAEARAVAHKKFLASRVADLAFYGAVAILWERFGTADIDALGARLATLAHVPFSVQLAGVLVVVAVALRSAQLPFHGWLIQVMEAPTPVSALLHAGVVNIGGFLIIRMASMMAHLEGARGLLVCVGTLTALLAGLVMTTRISVKVALAWSTCAQMGFMLLECGLGAYSLALLHLVAHSLYKAHAFLASGRAVEVHRAAAKETVRRPAGVVVHALAALLSGATLGALYMLLTKPLSLSTLGEPGTETPVLLVALALAPLYARAFGPGRAGVRAAMPAIGALMASAYLVAHGLVARVLAEGPPAPAGLRVAVLVAFVSSWTLQVMVGRWKNGRLARWLYPAAYAGFYLDDVVTRVAFRIAPPRPDPDALAPRGALLAEGRAS
jgi:NAD(P)H-quinone oxidoreductase subunit 5